MDPSALLFAFVMIALSAWVTYYWGIKPERERRRRHSENLNAHLREAARNAHSARRSG